MYFCQHLRECWLADILTEKDGLHLLKAFDPRTEDTYASGAHRNQTHDLTAIDAPSTHLLPLYILA
jgi:hypothetical protein